MRSFALLLLAACVAGTGCHEAFDLEEIAMDASEGDGRACPDTFDQAGHRFMDQYANWPAAQAACASLDEDTTDAWHTHLLVVSSSVELATLDLPQLTNSWLGLTDRDRGTGTFSKATFDWITSEVPASPTPWSTDVPESSGPAPWCGFRSSGDHLIHDVNCYMMTHKFVCECDQFASIASRIPP
jgi:hypothetical protein